MAPNKSSKESPEHLFLNSRERIPESKYHFLNTVPISVIQPILENKFSVPSTVKAPLSLPERAPPHHSMRATSLSVCCVPSDAVCTDPPPEDASSEGEGAIRCRVVFGESGAARAHHRVNEISFWKARATAQPGGAAPVQPRCLTRSEPVLRGPPLPRGSGSLALGVFSHLSRRAAAPERRARSALSTHAQSAAVARWLCAPAVSLARGRVMGAAAPPTPRASAATRVAGDRRAHRNAGLARARGGPRRPLGRQPAVRPHLEITGQARYTPRKGTNTFDVSSVGATTITLRAPARRRRGRRAGD
eukprot:gnl/Chilomastix_cuspidata/4091.p1 GENE.gnl/Chilomastix_cuspidata/4091~~gnl/Chilomastix_cuspidata/4091.p1  ORF type:complete len:304 (+),score=43.20 gnl/Chilomastix_cuspidata/4091:515-1426(+)